MIADNQDITLPVQSLHVIKTIYKNAVTGRAVYKAYDNDTQLYYTIKTFSLQRPNAQHEIKREQVALNKLDRPDLFPRCYRVWPDQKRGSYLMLLDWMKGKTFEEAFKGAPEDEADARLRLSALLELVKVIEVIHRKNILHRDLKPENVLLRNERRPKDGVMVIDFGLSVQDRSSEEGSAGYQAPEQYITRKENLRASADVFSIGQIGWRLFRGSPYPRYGDDDEIPKLPYGQEDVAHILFQATDRDPRKRPSVSNLKNTIRRFAKE